jgi:hypothetical protein
MLNLLADRKEFHGLAADPASLWPAFERGDAYAIDAVLSQVNLPGIPTQVDFAPSRGNYESRIFDEGILPVRKSSLHDLFNVIAWRTWPHSKRAINRIHNDAMKNESAGKRGPHRDFLTLLDEAGVLVMLDPSQSPATIASEIRRIRAGCEEKYPNAVHDLLLATNARLHIFGHALFESLVLRPQTLPKVGAFAVILSATSDDIFAADQSLASFLESSHAVLHPSLFPSLRLDVVFDALTRC